MSDRRQVRHDEGWARLEAMPVPEKGMSLEEIAEVVGCTRQNVALLERKALRKLEVWARECWGEGP